jgi:hypothetical protein
MRPEEAGDQLAAYEQNLNRFVDGLDLEADIFAIDAARAELLKNDPSAAEVYGLNKAEVEANAKPEQEFTIKTAEKAEPEATSTRQPNESDHDFAARQIFENPLAQEVLRSQVAANEQARSQYAEQINHAVRVAEVSFLSQFPEFRGVTDQNHLASIANSIQQQNPQRWNAIQQTAAQANQLLQAQAVEQQNQAAARQQQVAAWAAEQSKAYEVWAAKDGVNLSAVAPAAQKYLESLGASGRELNQLRADHPFVNSAFFQKVLTDATRYQMLKDAPRAVASRSRPSVQKPGNPDFRASARELGMAELEARLARSGSESDAWALLQAKMRGR